MLLQRLLLRGGCCCLPEILRLGLLYFEAVARLWVEQLPKRCATGTVPKSQIAETPYRNQGIYSSIAEASRDRPVHVFGGVFSLSLEVIKVHSYNTEAIQYHSSEYDRLIIVPRKRCCSVRCYHILNSYSASPDN